MPLPLAAIGLGITAASTLASIGQGIYNVSEQKKANNANIALQRDTYALQREQYDHNRAIQERDFEYNKALQREIFQREDSAVQRMVADNRAAGLSPIAGLAGAGTGQALEANSGQLNQTFDTPQMSANQLNIDFSSLGQLGSQISNYELNKKSMALAQEKFKLEKSSNEANLKMMEQNIEASKIRNQISRATMEAEIENKKLAPQKVAGEIAKIGVDNIGRGIENDLKSLSKIQTQREMNEWMENKGIRADLGKVSLSEAKAKLAALEMINKAHNDDFYATQLQVLKEQYTKLQNENAASLDVDYIRSAMLETASDFIPEGPANLFVEGLLKILGIKK